MERIAGLVEQADSEEYKRSIVSEEGGSMLLCVGLADEDEVEEGADRGLLSAASEPALPWKLMWLRGAYGTSFTEGGKTQ